MVICTCTVCKTKNLRGCNVAKTTRLAHEAADNANVMFQNANQFTDNNITAMEVDDDGRIIFSGIKLYISDTNLLLLLCLKK